MKKWIVLAILLISVTVSAESRSWKITWDDATAATDNQTPTTDTAMFVYGAATISISCSTETADDIGTTNSATSVDIDVLASADGINFDDVTLPYAAIITAMADTMATTIVLPPGMGYIKLRLDANGSGTADCTCRVIAQIRN